MALRSSGRKLSFEILSESSSVEEGQFLLYQSNTGPIEKVSASPEKPNRKKKKHRKKKPAESYSVVPEDPITESRFIDSNSAIQNGNVFLENRSSSVVGGGSVVYTVIDVAEVAECQSVLSISGSELRQRNVSNGGGGEEEMVSSSRWRRMGQWIAEWRQFKKPSAAELSDVGCFLVLASGVALLECTAQAITLSTCIVAHNNALLALLVSNNFAEIKSNVFKRFSKDNIHSLVYSGLRDAAIAFKFHAFLVNALMVFICEMLIDIIKHSFLAKFNDIKPIAYSEFLEELCNQVIRVLTPVYSAHLPYSPLPWRFPWILLLSAMIYVMLTSLKVMIGMGLQKHATWYINRCRKRKRHLHND
ncbi:hypothetical protein GH714_007524 [Hevea brasiliensis]|uniref:Uncharacterized protein n=1 Tax=Hevea brasiliensis TaxID=3981 RepID=A0A6A6LW43_HEVBR|nr:hypothetical protein GH714_007524 [Hevea brasiliensis]